MEEFLGKKYALVDYGNFEEYLLYIDVGFIARKVALTVKPVQSLTLNEDGTYTFNVHCALFNWDIVFTSGEEFDEKKPDGSTIKAKITVEGNNMIHIQHENGKISKHVIEFYPDKNVVTTTVEGWDKVVTRLYNLVK